jgi:hypothetical protein
VKPALRRLAFDLRIARERLGYRFAVPLECRPRGSTEGRDSPYDSIRFRVGGREALLCYGRPSTHGRRIFGELVPYGELWRTGANEPTTLHLPFEATVGGIRVGRGRYAIYTVPGEDRWTAVLNRSTGQSGRTRDERGKRGHLWPNGYTAAVRAHEVGRATVEARPIPHVEQLTFRAEERDDRRTDLLLEWATTRVEIPIEVG